MLHGLRRLLCVKRLNVTDGFTTRHVKLPRPEARIFAGELRNRQTTTLVRRAVRTGAGDTHCRAPPA